MTASCSSSDPTAPFLHRSLFGYIAGTRPLSFTYNILKHSRETPILSSVCANKFYEQTYFQGSSPPPPPLQASHLTRKMLFHLSANVTREDRYFSRYVNDYIIWVRCNDVSNLSPRRNRCNGSFFVSVMIRNDPIANFPLDKLMWELRTFAPRDFRKYIFSYVGEGKSDCLRIQDDSKRDYIS